MRLTPILTLALLFPASLAFAQDDPGQVFVDEGTAEQDPDYIEDDGTGYVEQDQYDDGTYDDGTQQGEYVAEPAYQDPNDPNAQVQQQPERLGRQLSLALDVPIFLTNASDIRPGVGAHIRFGYEFGMVVPQVKIGVSTNFLSDDAERLTGSTNLNAVWASVGIRLQILNRSRFVPVIDAGLRLQFWNYPDAFATTDYLFEPGVTVGGGLAIEITARFGLEVGVDAVVAFPISDAFFGYENDGTQFFLMPHLGGTLYF